MMFTQEGMAQIDAALAATQTARKQRMTVLQWPQPPSLDLRYWNTGRGYRKYRPKLLPQVSS